MKSLFLLLLIAFSINVSAQSPLRRLAPPPKTYRLSLVAAAPITQIAWRFTVPTVGYLYTKGNSQVATSLGFGWNRCVWDTANGGSWFTQIAVSGIILGGGNIAPNPTNPASVMSIGVAVTFMKGHISIGPVYNFPTAGKAKGLGQNLGIFAVVSIPHLL